MAKRFTVSGYPNPDPYKSDISPFSNEEEQKMLADGICPLCNGDCAGANPPVGDCPMREFDRDAISAIVLAYSSLTRREAADLLNGLRALGWRLTKAPRAD